MLEIVQLPALSDNYIYLVHDAASGAHRPLLFDQARTDLRHRRETAGQ